VALRAASDAQAVLTWRDRAGNVLGPAGDIPGAGNGPELSPDGRHVAFDRTVQGNRDVWFLELERGGLSRVTTDASVDGYPVWSPDGSQIVFESTRRGTFDLWRKASSGGGAEELLLETPDTDYPLQWSADGRFVIYQRTDLKEVWDLWALPMTGDNRTPFAVANTPFLERMGQLSPNGQWLAYETNETGRPEIVVQAFPEARGRWPVSTNGGEAPRWSADGRELFFIAPDRTIMAAMVTTTASTFGAGRPAALFGAQISSQPFRFPYTVARDGHFLINELQGLETAAIPITLILNWQGN
jgi:Tol biopolymer transport system component